MSVALAERPAEISEAIKQLDELREDVLFQDSNADPCEALCGSELAWIKREISRCARDFRYAAFNYFWLGQTKERREMLFRLWSVQEYFFSVVEYLWSIGRPAWIICHKARQIGLSSICAALLAWKNIFFEHQISAIIAQDPKQAEHLLKVTLYMIDRLPWWMKPMESSREFKEAMILENPDPSERAEKPGLDNWIIANGCNKISSFMQGKAITNLHACLSYNQKVITSDNYVKSIGELRRGDSVRTPTGKARVTCVSVRDASGVYNGAEIGFRLVAWGNSAFPIEGTGNHTLKAGVMIGSKLEKSVFRKGLYRLDQLSCEAGTNTLKKFKGVPPNCLAFPVRPINSNGNFPKMEIRLPARSTPWSPPSPSREFGFCIGLYLAEGYVGHASGSGKSANVQLTLNQNETDLAERFSKGVGLACPKKGQTPGSNAIRYSFSCSQFARWVERLFGSLSSKRVPDFCWSLGREFLAGIVEGMILGDGHRSQSVKGIYLTTTRPQLALALRDAILSLGHGYSSVQRHPSNPDDDDAKPEWVVFCGQVTSDSIREEYAWPRTSVPKRGDRSHWAYNDDKSEVYAGIRSIERIPLDDVWDIEIDDPEHLFLLPGAITHNSEVSSWDRNVALEILAGDTEYCLIEDPGCFAFLESKPRGVSGFWYDLWHTFEPQGHDAEYFPFYASCFFEKSRRRQPPPDWQADEEMVEVRETYCKDWQSCDECGTPLRTALGIDHCMRCQSVKLSPIFLGDDQLYWYWKKLRAAASVSEEKLKLFHQEMPIFPEQGFQHHAISVFPNDVMFRLQKTCRPGERGFFDDQFQWHAARHCKICRDDHFVGRGSKTIIEEFPTQIWEAPKEGCKYVLGIDVSEGSEEGDFSCIHVLRIGYGWELPDTQVCEWHGHIDGIEFARVCYIIGKAYNTGMLAIDAFGPGYGTQGVVMHQFNYPNIYRWKHLDNVRNISSNKAGVWPNQRTRRTMITVGIRWLRRGIWEIRSPRFLEEALFFVKDEEDAKAEALSGHFDDAVLAALYAIYAAHEDDYNPQTARYDIPSSVNLRPREKLWTVTCVRGHVFDSDDPKSAECQACKAQDPARKTLVKGAEKKLQSTRSLADSLIAQSERAPRAKPTDLIFEHL